ncbi:MAG: hypothetical protein KBF99_15875 [Leptospiraceae bacterium]|nr:hypothetical protein [Leptospiraceae bacterium]
MRISKKIAMTWFLKGILLIAALCNCKIVGWQHPNDGNEKWQTLLTAGLLNGFVNN